MEDQKEVERLVKQARTFCEDNVRGEWQAFKINRVGNGEFGVQVVVRGEQYPVVYAVDLRGGSRKGSQ